MAVVFVVAVCACSYGEVRIDTNAFPDEVFRAYVSENCDTDGDGLLTDEEIAGIKFIDVHGKPKRAYSYYESDDVQYVHDLSGIEYFTSLVSLDCSFNELGRIDLGSNTALEYLNCEFASLDRLDLGSNTALKSLFCGNSDYYERAVTYREHYDEADSTEGSPISYEIEIYPHNFIKSLNLGNNTSLEYLGCANCGLEELTLNSRTALKYLNCSNMGDTGIFYAYVHTTGDEDRYEIVSLAGNYLNRIKSIELGGYTALETLYCGSGDVQDIDVSGCSALKVLNCEQNKITALDVGDCTALEYLFCNDNRLTNIDVSHNTALQNFVCSNTPEQVFSFNNDGESPYTNEYVIGENSNHLTALDLSNNPAIGYLNCEFVGLESLNVSGNMQLTILVCNNNKLTELDFGGNTELMMLNCSYNHLKALDVSKQTGLTNLECSSNDIAVLEVGNKALFSLYCGENRITHLDLSKSTSLGSLQCEDNQIKNLDVSNNTSLWELLCYSNDLTELTIGNQPKLYTLYCSRNKLSALDVSGCPELSDFSCAKNQIRALDVTHNPELSQLYCHNNQITALDVTNCPELRRLSCTNNKLGKLDLSNNTLLEALDCGGNYLAALDVSSNVMLSELYFSGTPLRNVDLSANTSLMSLDCISADMTTLDLSNNIALAVGSVNCYGNSRLEALDVVSSDNTEYPFMTDMATYTGDSYARVQAVRAYTADGTEIASSFSSGDKYAYFAASPYYIIYDYDTGYAWTEYAQNVPGIMSVRMGIPTNTFSYLPQVESKVVSVDSKVVSIDEGVVFHSSGFSGGTGGGQKRDNGTVSPSPSGGTQDTQPGTVQAGSNSGPGTSSGGGCDSGIGIAALCVVFLVASRKTGRILPVMLLLVLIAATSAYAQTDMTASDYTLPTKYEIYDIAGSYTLDFALPAELAQKIAEVSRITPDKVHPYSDIALSGTWSVNAQDLYTLSRSGEYGGVVLPIAEHAMTSRDRYVVLCTFSNDVEPGEMISVHGFEVDPSLREAVYDENKMYMERFSVFNENFERIEKVPESRKVYLAVTFTPEYVNTGILSVVRGKYVEEEDPLYRLGEETAQLIADELGIDISELKYLTRANIGAPVRPTPAMQEYVRNDNHEIIANLPTVSVDEEGTYLIPVTLTDEAWNALQGQEVSGLKFYGLHDTDSGDKQFQASGILSVLPVGPVNLLEIYTLSGKKMEKFGAREFFMAAFLNAGEPFSFYAARMLLALATGGLSGCSTGIFTLGACLAGGLLFLKKHNKS